MVQLVEGGRFPAPGCGGRVRADLEGAQKITDAGTVAPSPSLHSPHLISWELAMSFRSAWLLMAALSAPLLAAGADPASPLEGLGFRLIGPQLDGRIAGVTGVPGDPLTWYLAAAQGGVWKSINGGRDWTPIFDQQPSGSVGSIAVAPSDPNVIYVGGGEANIRGNVQAGEGIFRSTDAGATWVQQFKLRGQIGRIAVHPADADTAYAAVLGNPFKADAQRGVYRTTDGGTHWQQVLSVDADTGASDISIDAHNPRILFAATWQTRRQPWGQTSGGAGSGLWRSTDAGDHWTRIEGKDSGLPQSLWGKVGVAISPADSTRVYVLIEADEGGLFRSTDGGKHYTRINEHQALRQRAWYYSTLTPHPTDVDTLWMPQVRMLRTIDGGKSVQSVPGFAHGDHHSIWIDPIDPRRMISGSDGGVDLSVDGGISWFHPRLPLAQFYNIDVDQRVPYHVGGTIQDLGTASGPAYSLLSGKAPLSEWHIAGGGEAGDFRYDRGQVGVSYAGEYGGYLSRDEEGSGQTHTISPWPANAIGYAAADLRYRFQWTAPIATSPHDTAILYHGAQVLFRSMDRGETWHAISGDLTRNDASKQQWSGGPITGDNTGVEVYDTIFSIAESPLQAGQIWVGSDDGLVHLTRNGGDDWVNVTPKDLPEWSTIEAIEPSHAAAGSVYVVAHRYRLGDDRPLLYRSDDYGQRWQKIVDGLPADMPLYALREDPEDANTLYLGAERDLYVSTDRGAHWRSMRLNLPPVAAVDLEISASGDLVVATRGRALWVLSDLAVVRKALGAAKDQAQLQAPASVVRWRGINQWGGSDGLANAERGLNLRYRLPKAVDAPIRLEIRDADGTLVRTLKSEPEASDYAPDDPDQPTPTPTAALSAKAGWNSANWDLRHTGAHKIAKAKVAFNDPYSGPLALPGRYQLTLVLPEQSLQASFELQADPRSGVSAEDLAAQLAFGLQLRQSLDRVADDIAKLRDWRAQAQHLTQRLAGRTEAASAIAAAEALIGESEAIEARLHNPKARVAYDFLAQRGGTQLHGQLGSLLGFSQDSDRAPTATMQARWAELSASEAQQHAAVEALAAGAVRRLEQSLEQAGIARITTP
jgi:photosystem II stability/assembly factor-like uncharacterized protein